MLKKFAYNTAILTCKIAGRFSVMLNLGSGTNLLGILAIRIAPDILSHLVNRSKKEIITVTGTNGKTTTSGFIAGILQANNRKIAHNRKGANMLGGILTALIEKSDINSKLDVDHCLLELDEAYLLKAVDKFNPDLLLVTNLFRDQLDRYGELDTTARKIQASIDKTSMIKPLKIILNADDPMVASLASDRKTEKIYYGFDRINFLNVDESVKSQQEVTNCRCGNKYEYSRLFYGHLGHYSCSCGKSRPEPDILARADRDFRV